MNSVPPIKKIIHIDMDCFYAAIEMRDNPKLKNRPIAVGGDFDKRGVLCTCNYIARKFGVRAAMPTTRAYQLCPDLLVLTPRIERYKVVSSEVRKIFASHTAKFEPLSLDEAYLDVTGTNECFGSATWLAQKIRDEIFKETQLTASAGIAPNKFLAKVASDWNKPNGQYVIPPDAIESFIKNLPVGKIFGVGKVMLEKLKTMGIMTCGDLQRYDLIFLANRFGVMGKRLYELSRGIDHREVEINRERKSISVEHTYTEDLTNLADCLEKLPGLIASLIRRQRHHQDTKSKSSIKSIFVKIKFHDFTQTTVDSTYNQIDPYKYLDLLTVAYMRRQKPVRLIGIGLRLNRKLQSQMTLEF